MNLDQYIKAGHATAKSLAQEIGAKSEQQVRQWQFGYQNRKPGAEYCVALEKVTKGLVNRQELRPSDYWRIWPDLAPPKYAKKEKP